MGHDIPVHKKNYYRLPEGTKILYAINSGRIRKTWMKSVLL